MLFLNYDNDCFIFHGKLMIKLFVFTVLVFCFNTIAAQPYYYKLNFNLKQGSSIKYFVVTYEYGSRNFADTIYRDENLLDFKKEIQQPVAASIITDDPRIAKLNVFLCDQPLNIKQESEILLSITPDSVQAAYAMLTANDRIRPRYFPLYGELNAKNDTLGLKQLGVIFDSLRIDDISKSKNFFSAYPASLLSLFAFSRFSSFSDNFASVAADFTQLPAWAQNSPDGKNIARKIEGALNAQIGTKAKNFSLPSVTDQPTDLSRFSGKYILLDFWASWCGPCRKEHPQFAAVYKLTKSKGFEIVSISLDTNKEAWFAAIKKDKMDWTNLSDLKGQQNAAALLYGVQTIPSNFLISPDGTIIGKDLRGNSLAEELEKIFHSPLNK
jgi:peroxiredoxin